MRKWLRCLICLLVICALLVNLSPIKAKATVSTATGIAVGVGIAFAVAAGMQALGVNYGTDTSAFESVVSACTEALSPTWAVDGLVTMVSTWADGIQKTYVSQNFLQAILDFLFGESGVLVSNQWVDRPYTSSTYSEALALAKSYPYAYKCTSDYWTILTVSREPIVFSDVDGVTNITATSSYYEWCSTWGTSWRVHDPGSYVGTLLYNYEFIGTAVSTTQDLTLEAVGSNLAEDYETWANTKIIPFNQNIMIPDNPNTPDNDESNDSSTWWIPLTVGAAAGAGTAIYVAQDQSTAQEGATDPEILEDLNPDAVVDPDPAPDTDSGDSGDGGSSDIKIDSTGDPDLVKFQLDLRELFPFCIPFDLYKMFACLVADPVAPVFTFAIPTLDETYTVTVDLSAWNNVAATVRTCQVALFCVGLVQATRKYIKW